MATMMMMTMMTMNHPSTNNTTTKDDVWHEAQLLREHVLERVEDRPHLYNNVVVMIEELERHANFLHPPTNQNSSSSSSLWKAAWFRTYKKKNSVVPLTFSSSTSSSSSPSPTTITTTTTTTTKLYCKKTAGRRQERRTWESCYQDLALLDQILMEDFCYFPPSLEAKLMLMRQRLQTEAVTLERCQSKWDAAAMTKTTATTTTRKARVNRPTPTIIPVSN